MEEILRERSWWSVSVSVPAQFGLPYKIRGAKMKQAVSFWLLFLARDRETHGGIGRCSFSFALQLL
jgi:hypothetical protein